MTSALLLITPEFLLLCWNIYFVSLLSGHLNLILNLSWSWTLIYTCLTQTSLPPFSDFCRFQRTGSRSQQLVGSWPDVLRHCGTEQDSDCCLIIWNQWTNHRSSCRHSEQHVVGLCTPCPAWSSADIRLMKSAAVQSRSMSRSINQLQPSIRSLLVPHFNHSLMERLNHRSSVMTKQSVSVESKLLCLCSCSADLRPEPWSIHQFSSEPNCYCSTSFFFFRFSFNLWLQL